MYLLYLSAQCPTPSTELVVAKKGVYCSASSSFHTMPCQVLKAPQFWQLVYVSRCWSFSFWVTIKVKFPQYAWDGDPNTVWHPTGSGEGAYTTLHLNEVSKHCSECYHSKLGIKISDQKCHIYSFAGHIGDRGGGGSIFLEQWICRQPRADAQLVRVDWTKGWGASANVSQQKFNCLVTDSSKKTIWEDTRAHATKVVTVFIKEVGLK